MKQSTKCFPNNLLLQISSDKEEQEVLEYGLHQLFIIAIDFLSVFICGIFWGELLFSVLLFLNLFFLRPYVGGYHADTEGRCYIISMGIMNLAMVGVKLINISVGLMILLCFIVIFIIWKNAPIENPINPLEDTEIQRYSKKAKQILVSYSLVAGMGICLHNAILYKSIFYGMAIAAISILAGKWKYRLQSYRH